MDSDTITDTLSNYLKKRKTIKSLYLRCIFTIVVYESKRKITPTLKRVFDILRPILEATPSLDKIIPSNVQNVSWMLCFATKKMKKQVLKMTVESESKRGLESIVSQTRSEITLIKVYLDLPQESPHLLKVASVLNNMKSQKATYYIIKALMANLADEAMVSKILKLDFEVPTNLETCLILCKTLPLVLYYLKDALTFNKASLFCIKVLEYSVEHRPKALEMFVMDKSKLRHIIASMFHNDGCRSVGALSVVKCITKIQVNCYVIMFTYSMVLYIYIQYVNISYTSMFPLIF